MRRRRRTKEAEVMGSLDSFLDIVTNTLGLLILISVLTVITARDIKINLGTPIMAPAPEKKERVLFECRYNRIIPVEEDYCKKDIERILESHASVARKKEMVKKLNDRMITNGYHEFRFRALDLSGLRPGLVFPALTMLPLGPKVGDTISMLRHSRAEYNARLAKLDPEKHWLCFITREDSFEVLRVARKIAKRHGFQVGWDPFESHLDIKFSPFGGGKGGTVDN